MSEPAVTGASRVLVGTAGFKYEDWKGPFYPDELKDQDMLRYYASQFPVVELDFTYYTMPGVRSMQGIEAKTPPGFQVCVKAHRSLTHERAATVEETRAAFSAFASSLSPLVQAGKLGCVLTQFPWSFKPCLENLDYLRRLGDWLPGLPVVVEFRNVQWLREETFELLSENSLGFCCVDEPRLRGL
ncbi:MAG: DUF72 domain-containing protein, partial [Acetobacteraceae bacterium]|nr:DUF72 domain-containing protein [Acetobacteraceae bacterium]